MIIGERGLIIGKIQTLISDFSISAFFYIKKQTNFLIKKINNIGFLNDIKNNSPPL